jgi:GGDEF domain-containing protein
VNRPEEAVRIAERLTEAARRTGRTISVGIALPHPGESPELTLRRADQALYAVKRHGRDGVRLAAA